VDRLYAGEVGYLSASIKAVADARVGDTITLKKVLSILAPWCTWSLGLQALPCHAAHF
jgi:translation elongation factor EF-4